MDAGAFLRLRLRLRGSRRSYTWAAGSPVSARPCRSAARRDSDARGIPPAPASRLAPLLHVRRGFPGFGQTLWEGQCANGDAWGIPPAPASRLAPLLHVGRGFCRFRADLVGRPQGANRMAEAFLRLRLRGSRRLHVGRGFSGFGQTLWERQGPNGDALGHSSGSGFAARAAPTRGPRVPSVSVRPCRSAARRDWMLRGIPPAPASRLAPLLQVDRGLGSGYRKGVRPGNECRPHGAA
jgi:hypothetical protein